jgi:hypothetical protein
VTDLEVRIQRLEDVESIRRLKHRYAELCDDAYQPEGLAALFTEDGVWDGGADYGVYTGRDEIAGYWRSCATSIPFALHLIVNHTVDVDEPGASASGWCNLFQPMTMNDEAYWAGVRYDEEYRVEAGEWRFRRITLTTRMLAPHAAGW